MAYWHQDENGRWYFDWFHLVPILPLVGFGIYALIRAAS